MLLHHEIVFFRIKDFHNLEENPNYSFPSLRLLEEDPWLRHSFFVVPQ
jgi:hypothetical protein